MLNDAGISLLSSAEYRFGGNAAARNMPVFSDLAVRTAGARSLSALRIRAESVACVAVSATNAVAMFTSVSFSSYCVQVAPQERAGPILSLISPLRDLDSARILRQEGVEITRLT